MDGLIVKASGRRDGRLLHYFGAIVDDNRRELTHSEYYEQVSGSPSASPHAHHSRTRS